MIAVVGSQSTGFFLLIQVKVHSWKVLLEKNYYQKEKVLLLVDQFKYNFVKSKAKNNMPNLSIEKENIIKTWSNSKN